MFSLDFFFFFLRVKLKPEPVALVQFLSLSKEMG